MQAGVVASRSTGRSFSSGRPKGLRGTREGVEILAPPLPKVYLKSRGRCGSFRHIFSPIALRVEDPRPPLRSVLSHIGEPIFA
jgi:hypothetical protein